MADKAEDAAGLAPFEDDNTVRYNTDRQDEWFSGGLTIYSVLYKNREINRILHSMSACKFRKIYRGFGTGETM